MCHGPSLDHIERAEERRQTRGRRSDAGELQPPAGAAYVAVCAQCHAQSAVHNAEPGGERQSFRSGAIYRAYPRELPSAFSRKAFYRDGRYRATTFISEAFSRSQCFRKGERDLRFVPRSASARMRHRTRHH